MNYLLALANIGLIVGWLTLRSYRKQTRFLERKVEGYRSALLAYMMYRYRDLARIERLESELKVCEFGRGKTHD